MLRAFLSWLIGPKPTVPTWAERKAAYDNAKARRDTRAMHEAWGPLNEAMNRRLASGQ